MSQVNVMAREIAAKIVFYGPGLSGKTTSLRKVYESVKPAHRGELMSLPTEADRTLFFDFLPVRVERVGEYSVRLALYTVPGQVFYNATRKLVLQGADGVIFVADSQTSADDSNRESMRNLEENLAEQGIALEKFPLVLQYNKRDLPQVLSVETMRAALNPRGCPDFESCATSGQGVIDGMRACMRLVIRELKSKRVVPATRQRQAPLAQPALSPEGLAGQIQRHLDADAERAVPLEHPPMATPARGLPAISAPARRPASTSTEAPSPRPEARRRYGPAAALAPAALVDPARVADAAFAQGDWDGCVRAAQETVRRALSFAAGSEPANQAFLLGVDGRDLLRLELLGTQGPPRLDDASFALYVLMQTLVRLAAAGLPHDAE